MQSGYRRCVSPAELFHFARLSCKRLDVHLLTRYEEARWRVSVGNNETEREREREAWRVCPEAVNIRLSVLVRMVPSAHQCYHRFLFHTLSNPQTKPETFVLLRKSHARAELSGILFTVSSQTCSFLSFITICSLQFCASKLRRAN